MYQKVIDRLKVGEGVLEESNFEWFTFPPIPEAYRPDYLVGIKHLASVRPRAPAVVRGGAAASVVRDQDDD